MNSDIFMWVGLGLSFLAVFLYSLFEVALDSSSKISVSRVLEDRDKDFRGRILDIYDELKTSAAIVRNFFLIAFIVLLYLLFPRAEQWPLFFFLGLIAVYLIFFEMIPRWLNTAYNRQILNFFLSSFKLPYYATMPLLWAVRERGPDKEPEEQREASEEEIDALIEEAEEEGIIEKEEGDLLKSVVEFGDTIVREIMTPRVSVICVPRTANIDALRELVIKEKHSRIPVYKDRIDNIDGIIIAKDLLGYSADRFKDQSLEPLLRPVYFIPESMKVAELLKEFQKRKQKLAIVVDEHGGVSGLVTMEDLMEEIVGEIQDEYDNDEIQIIPEEADTYIVLGDVEVEELEDLFDLELEDDDYITVGGLITHSLGRLPESGEKVEIKGLSLEILEVDQMRITKLRIKKVETQ
ncbi:MAG: hemolysin family protein [Candidatus Aminicenantaceae bacterium]